jgi:eukaryotic-like serine/threonine-protein kinase
MTVLGKYELIEQLGSGSMGIVYRARDTMLDRHVALKVLRPESQMDPEVAERFRREARACAQLHHPNLVTVYDLGEAEGGVTFIAMELLDGVDWRRAVKQQLQIPSVRKIELVAEVCEGLGHAHSNGIVHRDIKPGNLFLHLGKQTKILDFGIARLASSVLTRTGRILGTPNYMAPEQIVGEKCDSRSDLFAAAVASFELLTGCHPFEARFIPQRIVNELPDRLSDVAPGYPTELDEALWKAMARDPDDRFQTGEELACVVRGVLESGKLGPAADAARATGPSDGDFNAETATLHLSGFPAVGKNIGG